MTARAPEAGTWIMGVRSLPLGRVAHLAPIDGQPLWCSRPVLAVCGARFIGRGEAATGRRVCPACAVRALRLGLKYMSGCVP